MAITTLDLHKEIPKPIFWLAKPNKEIVGKLKVVYNHRVSFKLKKMDELSFSIPFQYEDERTHQLKENPYVDKIKQHYLIKFIYNGKEQWFKIVNISKSDNDKEEYTVSASSLETELKGKKLINYSVTSYNCEQVLTDALKGTKWSIGFIDPQYNKMYRNFETANKSVLDLIYNDMTETFEGSVAIFDTVDRTVSFRKESDLGENKGLRVKYKKYMENISEDSDADNIVTRLYVYGSESLGIERVNPTGESYIDDFSYFRTLDYMDQDLLDALDSYDNVLENASPIQDEAESGTDANTIKLSNHGLTTGDYIVNRTQGREVRKVTVVDSNTISVSSITDQSARDVIEKYSDGTFGKLLFEKEELQSQLSLRENQLNDLLTEKLIILDTLAFQYGSNTIDSYDGIISNQTITRRLSDLKPEDSYVAMIRVSTSSGTTVKLNGTNKSFSSNQWTILGKITGRETNEISVSTTQSNLSVKTLMVKITDEEYLESNNEWDLINKYSVDNKEIQINAKQNEIDDLIDDISNKDSEIESLRNAIKPQSNFTEEQLESLQDYIYEDEYRNENIIDDKDLYDIGVIELQKKNSPEIFYRTGIINFLESVTEQKNWKKLNISDKVTIIHPTLKINIIASIIEYEVDFENTSIDLTIASNKDVSSDKDSTLMWIYNSIHASNALKNKHEKWDNSFVNFNQRNDRIRVRPSNPRLNTNFSTIDHVVNDDGSVDISFEWEYDDYNDTELDQDNIDGFTVYVYASDNGSNYVLGSNRSKIESYQLSPDERSIILRGVPANKYYTFGIQAYRIVDEDINSEGIIKSNIIQPSLASENPYRPEDNVSYNGDIIGTIGGTPVDLIKNSAVNFNNRNDRLSSIPANPIMAANGVAIDHVINDDGSADISFEWRFGKNLIPTFDSGEWNIKTHEVLSPTKIKLQPVRQNADIILNVEPNVNYRLSAILSRDGLRVRVAENTGGTGTFIANYFMGDIETIFQSTTGQLYITLDILDEESTSPDYIVENIQIVKEIDDDTSYNIDGFAVHINQSSSSTPHSFGDNPKNEQVYFVDYNKRAFILYGVPANKYYTFGVQAYRNVDNDIEASGILKSSIIKPSLSEENPYRPSANVNFTGDITGTIGGKPYDEINKSTTTYIIGDESTSNNAKLADYIVPAGSKNAQNVINQAINDVSSTGGKIVLLDGTFVINGQINIHSNVSIEGQGDSTLILRDSSNTQGINMFSGSGVSNVKISNLAIDASNINNSMGIRFFQSAGIKIQSVKLTNKSTVLIEESEKTNISDLFCESGSHIRGWDSSELYLTNCVLNSSNITCSANNIINLSDILISNNTIRNGYLSFMGIPGTIIKNLIISSNTCVDGVGSFGMELYYLNYATVVGNVCNNNSLDGMFLYECNYSTFSDNSCQLNKQNGMYFNGCDNNNISDNVCTGNGQKNNNMYDNIIITGGFITNKYSSYNNIQGNMCRVGTNANKPRYGIRINSSSCVNNRVSNNDIYNSGVSGNLSDSGTGTETGSGNRV